MWAQNSIVCAHCVTVWWMVCTPVATVIYADCRYLLKTRSFSDSEGKRTYQIQSFVNCSSNFVIYQLSCPCDKIYIGKTKREFCRRMGEHLTSITKEDEESPVAIHFRDKHGASTNGFKCMVIYKLQLSDRTGDRDKILLQKEAKCIFLLNSMSRKGLNNDLSLHSFL